MRQAIRAGYVVLIRCLEPSMAFLMRAERFETRFDCVSGLFD